MSKKRKTPQSPEQKATWFMIRVAESMAAWTSFAQATFMAPVYSEALTYGPIFEIARSRPWKTRPQRKIAKRERKLGKNQSVDFSFQSEDGKVGIFLEVKFIRKKAEHCARITKDVHKLVLLDARDIDPKAPPENLFKYILLIGTETDIPSRIELFSKKLGPHDLRKLKYTEDLSLLAQVQSAFSNTIRKAKGQSAWAFPGAGNPKWRYWAVLLKEQPWWNELAKLTGKPAEDDEEVETDEDVPIIEDEVDDDDA
jgi:hypothetical protein